VKAGERFEKTMTGNMAYNGKPIRTVTGNIMVDEEPITSSEALREFEEGLRQDQKKVDDAIHNFQKEFYALIHFDSIVEYMKKLAGAIK